MSMWSLNEYKLHYIFFVRNFEKFRDFFSFFRGCELPVKGNVHDHFFFCQLLIASFVVYFWLLNCTISSPGYTVEWLDDKELGRVWKKQSRSDVCLQGLSRTTKSLGSGNCSPVRDSNRRDTGYNSEEMTHEPSCWAINCWHPHWQMYARNQCFPLLIFHPPPQVRTVNEYPVGHVCRSVLRTWSACSIFAWTWSISINFGMGGCLSAKGVPNLILVRIGPLCTTI